MLATSVFYQINVWRTWTAMVDTKKIAQDWEISSLIGQNMFKKNPKAHIRDINHAQTGRSNKTASQKQKIENIKEISTNSIG